MTRILEASLKQKEAWGYNYILPANRPPHMIEIALRIRNLNFEAISRTYQQILQRHEILRAHFPLNNGEIVQVIDTYSETRFGILVQEAGTSAEGIAAAIDLLQFQLKDIQAGPPIKAMLYQKEELHILLIFIHHIVVDMWSVNIIKNEIRKLYDNFKSNRPDRLIDPPEQYEDYLRSHGAKLAVKHVEAVNYWRNKLQDKQWQIDFNGLVLKLQGAINVGISNCIAHSQDLNEISRERFLQKREGELFTVTMDSELYRRLIQFRDDHGFTTFTVLVGCFSLLLHNLTSNRQLLVISEFYNRTTRYTEKMIANFLAKIFLSFEMDAGDTPIDYFSKCYNSFLFSSSKVIFNTDYLEELDLFTRNMCFFNFIPRAMSGNKDVESSAGSFQTDIWVGTPMVCEATEYRNRILFDWSYHRLFFNRDSIRFMANEFFKLLSALLSSPNKAIGEIL